MTTSLLKTGLQNKFQDRLEGGGGRRGGGGHAFEDICGVNWKVVVIWQHLTVDIL